MTPRVITQSPRQLWQHLLCSECEQEINQKGEIPALNLLNRKSGFPLLELMSTSRSVGQDGDATVFSGKDMGVDTEALAYFALGIIWKGSATVWNSLKGQTTSVALGSHQESIRRYLAGEDVFPPYVRVVATVCEDFGSQGAVLSPWALPFDLTGPEYGQVEVLTRGLWFRVILGSGAPRAPERLCCVRSEKRVIFRRNCEDDLLQARDHFYNKAEISVKIR